MLKVSTSVFTFAVLLGGLLGAPAARAEGEVDCGKFIKSGGKLGTTNIHFFADPPGRSYGTHTGHIVTFSSVTGNSFSGSFGSGGAIYGSWSGSNFLMLNPTYDQEYRGKCYIDGIRGNEYETGTATAMANFTFAP